MNISAPPALLAPQTTGHPQGLPEEQKIMRPDNRVASVSNESNTSNAASREHTQTTDRRSQQKNAGNPETAPPTILQLKINQMLQEQAEAIERNMPDTTAEPEDAAPPPVTNETDEVLPSATSSEANADAKPVVDEASAQPGSVQQPSPDTATVRDRQPDLAAER